MTSKEFIAALWQYKQEDQHILIWTGQDKRSRWFQDIGRVAEYIESDACRGKCVFVGIGSSKTGNGPTRRCSSAEITSLCAVWSDLDLKGEAHQGKALPGNVDDALSVLPKDMPPSITVSTGNGVHAWWIFKEPLVFDTEESRKDAMRVLSRWHTLVRFRCAARGWAYDRLSDLARVARVPGTLNMKDPANPKPVVVISTSERRYELSEFDEYADDAGIPDDDARELRAREWAERFKNKPIAINNAARIPNELLAAWMDPSNSDEQTATRFRHTWNRERHDLKDPSQSGYDLALADFGVMAGLNEQQIVDLICHHRAKHGKKQRNNEDYFYRTLGKATGRNPAAPAPAMEAATPEKPIPAATAPAAPIPQAATAAGAQAPAATADASAGAKEMSPEDLKASLCDKISQAIGIPISITRLIRITGKDPSYRMELANEQKIEFTTVSKFRNQEAVRDALAAQTKWIMPPIKAAIWRELAQDMQNALFDEEGPIEVRWEDAARDTVGRYLEANGFIEDISGAQPQYRLKPIIKDGHIAINTTDFHGWINRTTFQNLSPKALASQLSAIGALPRRVTGKGFREQSRWLLPTDHFDPAEYQKGVAATENGEAA